MDDAEVIPPYNAVLEYLVGLSKRDYQKVIKVAGIYRQADQDACDALGKPNEPTTFIEILKSKGKLSELPRESLLDEDDELAAAFLEDDEPEPKPDKKIKVNKG